MAAKWQTWMPRVIDPWLGSLKTAALSDTAYRAYDNLLMAEWQSEDGMLSADEKYLAQASRVNGKWPKVRDEVLGMFKRDDDRLYNPRLLAEWKRAYKVFMRQRGRPKSTDQKDLDFDKLPISYPDTATATSTTTKSFAYTRRGSPDPLVGARRPAEAPQATGPGEDEQAYWRRVYARSQAEFNSQAPQWAREFITEEQRSAAHG